MTQDERTEQGAQVITLSGWRARVARARRPVQVRDLVHHPQAASLVQAMPVEDVFFMIKGAGIADALELIELCNPRQVQGFVDLDCWDRDHIDPTRLGRWMEALLSLPLESVATFLVGMDPEIWLLFLRSHLKVHDHTDEQANAFHRDQVVIESPDRLYFVEVLEPQSREAEIVLQFIKILFGLDNPLFWRRLLESVRIEIGSEVQETAYRFRRARLQELGFVDYYEALEDLAYLNPAHYRGALVLGENQASGEIPDRDTVALPTPFAGPLGQESFLAHTMARISDEAELDELTVQMVALANRVLSADRTDLGDPDSVSAAVSRMRDSLSIGLDFLSDGDVDLASRIARARPLRELMRVGLSLTVDLGKAARALTRHGWLSRPYARDELLDPDDLQVLRGLERERPVFFSSLADAGSGHRPFESYPEVDLARERLSEIDLAGQLMLEGFGLDPGTTPKSLPLSALFRTAACHLSLGNGFVFDPLSLTELQGVLRTAFEGTSPRRLSEDLREEVTLLCEGRVASVEARQLVRTLVVRWLEPLEEELAGLDPSEAPDPRFISAVWIARARR